MVVDTKLYELLGVKPDVSERDLKKAYMTKARELHPDKNRDDPEATAKFQAMNEAYEVLKDPQKREQYDRFGLDALKEGMGPGGADIFSQFFGGGFGFDGFSRGKPRRQRTQDVRYDQKVSLEDLYNGAEIKLKINRQVICPDCSGTGCNKGKKPKKCSDCQGRGQKVQVVRMGPMISQQVTTCPTCRGTGEEVSREDKCKKCNGEKVIEEKKLIVVHVERGMEDGEAVIFKGSADEHPEADPGDVVVIMKQKPHSHFIRRHDDLMIKKKISLTEALLGTKFPIKHLDDRVLIVEHKPGTVITPGSVKVIEREGMPNRSNPFERGRLFIQFEIEFPASNKITPELRTVLTQVLPPPNEAAGINLEDENVFQATMVDSDLKTFESAKRNADDERREAYGSDEHERSSGTTNCQPM